jgi:hypothetical protein
MPRDKENRVGKYPHQILAKLPIPIELKKLIVANTFIEYKQFNPVTQRSGSIRFHNTYAVISNVTNTEAAEPNNLMIADISTKFLNKTTLDVNWKFYLGNPRGRFDISGKLGSLDLAAVNTVSVPMGPAELKDGRLQQLLFNFKGNNYNLDGTVKMLYKDLKVAILEKEEGTRELDKKTVASLAANIFIKNNNPGSEKEEPRVITVNFERDTNRSIFSLVWKSLFKGIKESAGIKK